MQLSLRQSIKHFIYPNITFCYFYVINNPEINVKNIDKRISTEASYDELFNFNDKQYLNSDQKDLSFKYMSIEKIVL